MSLHVFKHLFGLQFVEISLYSAETATFFAHFIDFILQRTNTAVSFANFVLAC